MGAESWKELAVAEGRSEALLRLFVATRIPLSRPHGTTRKGGSELRAVRGVRRWSVLDRPGPSPRACSKRPICHPKPIAIRAHHEKMQSDEMPVPGIGHRNTDRDAGQRAPLAPADPGSSRVGRVRDRRGKSSGDRRVEQHRDAHFRRGEQRSERKKLGLARSKNTCPPPAVGCGQPVDNICRLLATDAATIVCAHGCVRSKSDWKRSLRPRRMRGRFQPAFAPVTLRTNARRLPSAPNPNRWYMRSAGTLRQSTAQVTASMRGSAAI